MHKSEQHFLTAFAEQAFSTAEGKGTLEHVVLVWRLPLGDCGCAAAKRGSAGTD